MHYPITFLLNGDKVHVQNVSPTMTLLQWLRELHHQTGTKEGCAEGDCGACTVVIGELDDLQSSEKTAVHFYTINACIRFLPSLNGRAVFTVEYLKKTMVQVDELHPVQKAMVNAHGSQCGFCTPGFMMSLWNTYLQHESNPSDTISKKELANELSGNLCRCTGYRPIIEAGQKMMSLPRVTMNREAIKTSLLTINADIKAHLSNDTYTYLAPQIGENPREQFSSPRTISAWLALRAQYPQSTVLAGATDVGLWSTKQLRTLPHLLYIGDIAELKSIKISHQEINIGAGVSLNKAFSALTKHYPSLQEIWERFASMPIRHSGTLGGNIANGSPIGDSMPALIVLGARIVLGQWKDERIVTRDMLLEDFYIAYQKKAWLEHEVLLSVKIPLPQPHWKFASYKVSKRYDSDISAVCGAYALLLHEGKVSDIRIAYGGMAATSKRAKQAEAVLLGLPWNNEQISLAQNALSKDFQPLTDMRAHADYRQLIAKNLLQRFYLSTHPNHPLSQDELSVFVESLTDSVS